MSELVNERAEQATEIEHDEVGTRQRDEDRVSRLAERGRRLESEGRQCEERRMSSELIAHIADYFEGRSRGVRTPYKPFRLVANGY